MQREVRRVRASESWGISGRRERDHIVVDERSRSRASPEGDKNNFLEGFRALNEGLPPARAGASVRAMPEPAPNKIYALPSGPPPAAIAVVRISGAAAGEALKTVIGKIP